MSLRVFTINKNQFLSFAHVGDTNGSFYSTVQKDVDSIFWD